MFVGTRQGVPSGPPNAFQQTFGLIIGPATWLSIFSSAFGTLKDSKDVSAALLGRLDGLY